MTKDRQAARAERQQAKAAKQAAKSASKADAKADDAKPDSAEKARRKSARALAALFEANDGELERFGKKHGLTQATTLADLSSARDVLVAVAAALGTGDEGAWSRVREIAGTLDATPDDAPVPDGAVVAPPMLGLPVVIVPTTPAKPTAPTALVVPAGEAERPPAGVPARPSMASVERGGSALPSASGPALGVSSTRPAAVPSYLQAAPGAPSAPSSLAFAQPSPAFAPPPPDSAPPPSVVGVPFIEGPAARPETAAPPSPPVEPHDPLMETLLPMRPRHRAPTLPFQGAVPPPRPTVDPAEPLSAEASALSLHQYASLCVELADSPAEVHATLARYRISHAQRSALDAVWSARFAERAELRRAWEEACLTYRQWRASRDGA